MSFDGIGISRATYGDGETQAIRTVAARVEREGLVQHDVVEDGGLVEVEAGEDLAGERGRGDAAGGDERERSP